MSLHNKNCKREVLLEFASFGDLRSQHTQLEGLAGWPRREALVAEFLVLDSKTSAKIQAS